MFTINGIKNLGKITLKWSNEDAPSQSVSKQEITGNDFAKLRSLWKDASGLNYKAKREEFLKLLQKVTADNEQQTKDLYTQIDSYISVSGAEGDSSGVDMMQSFRKTIEGDLATLKKKAQSDASIVKDTSEKNRIEVKSEVVDTTKQTDSLKNILTDANTVGSKALLLAMTEKEIDGNFTMKKITDVKLSDTTVGSVILTLIALHKVSPAQPITEAEFKKSYVSNGAYWFGDAQTIPKLLEVFNDEKNRKDIVAVFEKIAPAYQALGTTVQYEKNQTTVNKLTTQNILDTLSDLPRFGGDKSMKKKLETMLSSIPEDKRASRIAGIIAIGGGNETATDITGLINAFKTNPSLLSQYYAGMNLLGNKGEKSLGNYLRSGTYELAPDTKKLDEDMKKIVEELRGKGVKAIAKSPMTADEKAKANIELDKRYQLLNSPESIRTLSYNAAAVATNSGVGLGAGVSTEMKTMVSDSISLNLFGGIGSGSFDLGAALIASKEITRTKDSSFGVFYGLTASLKEGVGPVAGVRGSYGDVLYSFYANMLGAGGFVGMRQGLNQNSAETMKAIAETPSAVKEMIEKGINNKTQFKIETGNPANNEWINGRIQELLVAGKYDELSLEQKPIALHSALLDAVREKANMIKEMQKDNEIGLSVIGLNFGKFAGLTYVIPGFSWSKVDTFHMTVASGNVSKKEEDKKSVTYKIERDIMVGNKMVYTFNSPLPEDVQLPDPRMQLSEDRKTLSAPATHNVLLQRREDGRVQIDFLEKVDPAVDSGVAKEKNTVEMNNVIRGSDYRSALSYFAAVVDKRKAGDLISRIDQNLNSGNDDVIRGIGSELAKLLSLKTANQEMNSILKTLANNLGKESDPAKLNMQIRLMRDALMTDRAQAGSINQSPRVAQKGEKSNLQYYRDMLESKGFTEALTGTSLEKSDFAVLNPENADKVGYIPTPRKKMIGAVASWKFPPAHMAYLPSGAVWTSSEPQKTTKKQEALTTLEKAVGSILGTELTQVKATLEKPFGRPVTDQEIKNLLLGNEVKNGAKTLKLDAEFYTFCYGACMNPSVGMEIGGYTVTEPGKPMATGSATIETTVPGSSETQDMAFSSTSRTLTGTIALGYTRVDEVVSAKPSTDPDKIPGNSNHVDTGGTGGSAPRPGVVSPAQVAPPGVQPTISPASGLGELTADMLASI